MKFKGFIIAECIFFTAMLAKVSQRALRLRSFDFLVLLEVKKIPAESAD